MNKIVVVLPSVTLLLVQVQRENRKLQVLGTVPGIWNQTPDMYCSYACSCELGELFLNRTTTVLYGIL
jgi:hypothetical protein